MDLFFEFFTLLDKLGLDSKQTKHPTHCKSNSRKSLQWTDQEVTKLEKLYEKYIYLQEEAGRKVMWKAIAKELGKKAASCRYRYYSLKRAKQDIFLEQKHQTPSDQIVSKTKGFDIASSELKATIHNTHRCRPRWTKEEERILLEAFDMNGKQNHDFSTIAESFGRTPAACKKRLYECK